MNLDEIALRYSTDKASDGHNYTPVYEILFGPIRHDPVNLLELGVAGGASLRTWGEYFTHPQTIIVGIDIDLGMDGQGAHGCYRPFRQGYGPPKPGITTYLGDQTQVPQALGGWRPNIVIDDASHLSSKTIASFRTWFSVLLPGGLYCVEDVHVSYDPTLIGPEASSDPDAVPPYGGPTTMQFLRRLADEVQAQCPESAFTIPIASKFRLGFDIDWLSFHPNLVIAHKRVDSESPEHHEKLP